MPTRLVWWWLGLVGGCIHEQRDARAVACSVNWMIAISDVTDDAMN